MAAAVYHSTRCKVCRTPIRGIGSVPFRLRGIGPYPKNPQLCDRCSRTDFPAEEREITVLFADVRGLTPFSEHAHAVNVAARLAGLAQPGEILAACATCAELLDDLPPPYVAQPTRVAVKGRTDPVDAYRIALPALWRPP